MRSLSKKLRANLAVLLIANIFALAFIARIAIATGNSDGYKVFGYAWSSNVGWMSANSCTETLTCGSTPYGVKIAPDGTFSGRMWSPTIGWISFDANAVSGCPVFLTPPNLARHMLISTPTEHLSQIARLAMLT